MNTTYFQWKIFIRYVIGYLNFFVFEYTCGSGRCCRTWRWRWGRCAAAVGAVAYVACFQVADPFVPSIQLHNFHVLLAICPIQPGSSHLLGRLWAAQLLTCRHGRSCMCTRTSSAPLFEVLTNKINSIFILDCWF